LDSQHFTDLHMRWISVSGGSREGGRVLFIPLVDQHVSLTKKDQINLLLRGCFLTL